jgi:hypothetical protein
MAALVGLLTFLIDVISGSLMCREALGGVGALRAIGRVVYVV